MYSWHDHASLYSWLDHTCGNIVMFCTNTVMAVHSTAFKNRYTFFHTGRSRPLSVRVGDEEDQIAASTRWVLRRMIVCPADDHWIPLLELTMMNSVIVTSDGWIDVAQSSSVDRWNSTTILSIHISQAATTQLEVWGVDLQRYTDAVSKRWYIILTA